MTSELNGRRIIITGGGSGMGAGLVKDFTAQGAHVVSLDRDDARNAEVVAQANAKGPGKAEAFNCDVSDKTSVDQAFDGAVASMGGLEVLVHAAGIAPGSPADAITVEGWNGMFAVNALGTLLTNQAAFRHLKAKGGRILNFASGAGVRGYPSKAHYAASKGAVIAWSRSIAVEWAPFGVTVNMIVPAIRTPMYEKTRASMSPERLAAHDAQLAIDMPIGGKLGDLETDLVPVLRFLAGDGARFMTGQMFAIDGGKTMVR